MVALKHSVAAIYRGMDDPWVKVIDAEVALAIFDGYTAPIPPPLPNERNYPCEHHDCSRPAISRRLCNLHYLRMKAGKPMDAPFRRGRTLAPCRKCGKPSAKGGWSLCGRHYREIRRDATKAALIRLMGGSCQACGGVFPAPVYDFHHIAGKDFSPAALLSGGFATKRTVAEVRKCVLLCANCHRIEHFT